MPEPINRDWIEAELRSLRDIVVAEQARVNERFLQVNELRQQVLEERGVFVRHEGLSALDGRVARLEQTIVGREGYDRLAARVGSIEQTFIARPEWDTLGSRVFLIEKNGITRLEYDQHGGRIGKLEALGPIIVLVSGVIGAVIGGLVIRYFSG